MGMPVCLPLFLSWVLSTQINLRKGRLNLLSFFFGWRRPNLITGLKLEQVVNTESIT